MVLFAVEIQGLRDTQPREMLITVGSSLAVESGKSPRKTRRRKRRNNNLKDVLSSDITRQENAVTQSDDVQSLTAVIGETYQAEPFKELFEVKRYPAYHYDMYGTIYSLTDGIRPTTLERNTMKSASAECLDVHTHSITAQPSERRSSNDQVCSSASAVTAEHRKPKPLAKPLKPLPRPKPRPDVSGKDTGVQTALKSASTDPAFVAELSSLLKQRNQ